jgi:hypothetical protein
MRTIQIIKSMPRIITTFCVFWASGWLWLIVFDLHHNHSAWMSYQIAASLIFVLMLSILIVGELWAVWRSIKPEFRLMVLKWKYERLTERLGKPENYRHPDFGKLKNQQYDLDCEIKNLEK